MSKIYFTLIGTRYYHGNDFLKPGMKLKLKKEPDNKYDKEAILVMLEGIGEIGHVANSTYTVIGESMSAGRIYDKIGDTAKAKVVHVIEHGTICSLSKKSLIV
ncbi:MAG: HIRAN domain-containing protein [Eubacteriales bacterium]|nr:HIRAN domain-containing protein [Eubacteriales bacterium]